MERLTKHKYNKDTNTKYISVNQDEAIERLGEIEDILEKYKFESDIELERHLILGASAYSRIKLAMGNKVYFLSGNKIRKAKLIGYAQNGMSLDELLIEKKDQTASIPYTHLYISKHEARRARKGRQIYSLGKKEFELIFKNSPFKKKCFLLEVGRGTDTFVIVQKVFKTYYKTLDSNEYNINDLKEKFGLDILLVYPKERKEYQERTKHIKDKWI